MTTTWNRWIRQEYNRATATPRSIEPTYDHAILIWVGLSGTTYGLRLNPDDSLAYNMARVVWRIDGLSEDRAFSSYLQNRTRYRAHNRFNELVDRARSIGLRVTRNRSIHGDVAWNVMRARWLESQLVDVPVASVTTIPPATQTETAIAQLLPSDALATDLSIDTMTFGIEIECIRPSDLSTQALANLLTEAGVATQVESYNHQRRHHWKLVTDASVSDRNGVGCELVSPVLRGEAGFEILRRACTVLTERCRVNRTCGLHVHVGVRGLGREVDFFRNLLIAYAAFEPTIDSFMAPSRRANSNTYCRSVRVSQAMRSAQNLHALRTAYNETGNYAGRFRKVNLESFWRHSTVEFRHHQGTTEAEKAINWVRFCLKMCLKAAHGTSIPTILASDALDALMLFIEADETEKSYFVRRQALLTPALGEVTLAAA